MGVVEKQILKLTSASTGVEVEVRDELGSMFFLTNLYTLNLTSIRDELTCL